MSCCQRMKRSESASCGQESAGAGAGSPWAHVWGGFFDGETFSVWGSVVYEGSMIGTGNAACVSGNESESGGEVFPSCCPSPSPGTWAFPLSFVSSLVRAL